MRNVTLFRQLVVAVALVLAVGTAQRAQAQAPSTGGPTPQAPDPTAVPLDGGVSLLLAGGMAFGLRKLRQRRC